MRKLRLSIVLPAIQCSLEAILLNGGVHLAPSSPGSTDAHYPYFSARAGLALALNPPAAIVVTPIYGLANWLRSFISTRSIGPTGFEIIFLICVLATWYPIGRWLDRRAATEEPIYLPKPTLIGFLLRLVALGAGLFFVAVFGIYQGFFRGGSLSWPEVHWAKILSFSWTLHSFDEIIALSMFRAWGVFLIGAPSITFVRWVRRSRRGEATPEVRGRGPSRPLSNFRWFLIATGLFAVLFFGTVIFER